VGKGLRAEALKVREIVKMLKVKKIVKTLNVNCLLSASRLIVN
jgi:hypothetical protein